MGLDQYLRRTTSVHSFWLNTPKMKELGLKPKIILEDLGSIDPDKICSIVEEIGYWRKCNAIHHWFVENVQGGEDDCRPYPVGRDELEDLLTICEEIWENYLENKNNHGQPNEEAKQFAQDNLPNVEGFFFGNQEYNKDYFEWQIQPTIETLKPIIDAGEPLLFQHYEYQASW
jgi:hypothetical protein